MKVLAAPLNVTHKQEGQLDGLRKVFGESHVVDFDFWAMKEAKVSRDKINGELFHLAMDFKPDWIWLQIQGTAVIDAAQVEILKDALPHCVITHWMGDIRERVLDSLAAMCRVCDATLISSVGQIPMFQAAGAKRVEYVQIGLDHKADILGEPAWEPPFEVPPVVFIGNYYANVFAEGTTERIEAIRFLVDNGIPIGVVGAGWPKDIPVIGRCHPKQQHHVYKRAKVALSINHFNAIERYYSDRFLIALASGTPVVARRVPGIEEEFTDTECMFWRTHEELLGCVTTLLEDSTIGGAIGRWGQQKAITEHTWEARFRELAPKIEAWRE